MSEEKNRKLKIEVITKDNKYLQTLDKLDEWQQDWLDIKFIDLFILESKMFVNDDAKKIFQNILVDSCEFIPEISFSQDYYPKAIIDTKEITYSRCLEIIEMIQIMIERSNDISNILSKDVAREKVNQGLLTRYKMLIEGMKTTYEKGLILVKLLFKDNGGNGLLSKYYRLIQKKESFDTRKEIFYDLLSIGSEPVMVNNIKCKQRKK